MNVRSNTPLRRGFAIIVYLFAAIGLGTSLYLLYWYVRLPHVAASPAAFLVIDVNGSDDFKTADMRIYLDSPSSPKDIRFEGEGLVHKFSEKQQIQTGPGPLQEVLVRGKGAIRFESTVISVEGNKIAINGQSVCPSEITVTRHGTYREGYIRTAH